MNYAAGNTHLAGSGFCLPHIVKSLWPWSLPLSVSLLGGLHKPAQERFWLWAALRETPSPEEDMKHALSYCLEGFERWKDKSKAIFELNKNTGKLDLNLWHELVEGAVFWGKASLWRCSQEVRANTRLSVSYLHPAEAKEELIYVFVFQFACLFKVWEPRACAFARRWHYRVHVCWAYVRGELNCLERSLWAYQQRDEKRQTFWGCFS